MTILSGGSCLSFTGGSILCAPCVFLWQFAFCPRSVSAVIATPGSSAPLPPTDKIAAGEVQHGTSDEPDAHRILGRRRTLRLLQRLPNPSDLSHPPSPDPRRSRTTSGASLRCATGLSAPPAPGSACSSVTRSIFLEQYMYEYICVCARRSCFFDSAAGTTRICGGGGCVKNRGNLSDVENPAESRPGGRDSGAACSRAKGGPAERADAGRYSFRDFLR